MPIHNNPIKRLLIPISGIHPFSRNAAFLFRIKLSFLILIISNIFSIGCTAIHHPVTKEAFSAHEASNLVLEMMDQEGMVDSFYSSGTVLLKGWLLESEADILIAGIRDPLKIKIEITHPWGLPILHLLIYDNKLEVLSFDEKRVYIGDLTAEAISSFLAGEFRDPYVIWSVLRGYTPIAGHERIASLGMNRISLMNQEDMETEIIELYSDNLLPKRAFFPEDSLDITFSKFNENEGIYYASEVMVNNIKGNRDLLLKRKEIVFNKPIPDQIFTIEKPSTFENVYMN